ncbi:MAG: redoxin domain-containing protein [Bacteroidetes bacterium]|nr:redoxin domain-containing protein [Bacteroidota bacterium]
MKHYLLLLLIPALLPTQKTYSQHVRTISGLVTCHEDASPLEGVLVYAKGTQKASGSQQDGMYYLEVSDKDSILIFKHNEFQTQEIKLTACSEYNIALDKGQSTPSAAQPASAPFSPLGSWRAVFQLRPDVEVPINFDIRPTTSGKQKVFFRNGDEQFEGGWVRQEQDSLFLLLDQFDNELAFKISDGTLSGALRKQDHSGFSLPVKAEPGQTSRFKETGTAPAGDFSGTYDVIFRSENGKEEKAVGLFRQKGNKLSGTFLRVTGDSRYLEGLVEGDQFYLSSFIGSSPSYYKGSFSKDGKLTGEIVGSRSSTAFTGVSNPKAALPDPYKLTHLKEGYSSFDFSFPDIDGHTVSLKDPKFKDKVVIVTIGGTWCPNCVDETSFLAPWYKANHARGVEVVTIQYERQTDPAFVKKVLTRFRDKYDITYTQVFGGIADKAEVAKSLPSLNTFLAFPTTIIIDRKGRVAQIHTGYSGPATGEYYTQFVEEFNKEIDTLLKN